MENNEILQSFIELQPGTTLNNGKYVIEKKIGVGGFGITYKAMQIGLDRIVCIKEYFPENSKCTRNSRLRTVIPQQHPGLFEKYRDAFVKEARILDGLKHPNIVEVIDVFYENNTAYMVMSFIHGITIQNLVEKNGPLQYSEAVNYVGQITNAIDFVHKHHILHRDIKPDNIIITSDYRAILIDFGSAREFEQDKTQVHTSIFTRCYAPPEQLEANSRKGSYTDIYAIGATLYFALTGREPLEAGTRSIEKMQAPKELNASIPEEINRTIMKAMQLKPENRHQTIKEFMDDLLNIRPSEEIKDEVEVAKNIIAKRNRIRKLVSYSVVASVVIIVSIFIIRYISKLPPKWNGLTNEIEMVWVEGGTYDMGINSQDDDSDVSPRHKVKLDGYYISKYEITQAQWESVMGNNPSEHVGFNLPVESVSWNEVQRFVNELNRKTGGNYSLPTEAQWEYAARGGVKYNPKKTKNLMRYAGSNDVNEIAWYEDNCDKPQIVGRKKPNQLDIYDMNGNVSEWCLDWYDENYYKNSPYSNPCNYVQKYNDKVIRGYCYYDEKDDISCIGREYEHYSNMRDDGVGFRIVLNKN